MKKQTSKKKERKIRAWGIYTPKHHKFVLYNPQPGTKLAVEPPAIYLEEFLADQALAASKRESPNTDYTKIKVLITYTV
jgi:hypothetical protein